MYSYEKFLRYNFINVSTDLLWSLSTATDTDRIANISIMNKVRTYIYEIYMYIHVGDGTYIYIDVIN